MDVGPESLKAAQAVFDRATGRSLRAYTAIMSLLEFMHVGVPPLREHFVERFADGIKDLSNISAWD
jgi:hypothetical protein